MATILIRVLRSSLRDVEAEKNVASFNGDGMERSQLSAALADALATIARAYELPNGLKP